MAVLLTSGTLKTEVETEQVFGKNENSQNLSIDFSSYNRVKSLIYQCYRVLIVTRQVFVYILYIYITNSLKQTYTHSAHDNTLTH